MNASLQRRAILFAVSVVVAVILLLPTFVPELKNSKYLRHIALGLDLSGGVHLVYQVETKEAVKSSLNTSLNAVRASLRADKIAVVKSKVTDPNRLELTLLSETAVDRAKSKIEKDYSQFSFVEKADDGGRPRLVYEIPVRTTADMERESVSQAIETLRNRVDRFGLAEPLIQRVGESRILLQMPGVSDIERVKRVVGSVAKLEFRLVPQGGSEGQVTLKSKQGGPVSVEDHALMTGDAVREARVEVTNEGVAVSLLLSPEGAQTFYTITNENVGRQLAIVLDNVVYSSPQIREPIGGGSARISGGFTFEEASDLAVVLRAGALPAPLTVLEERMVGPSLGAESIRKGIIAIVIGFAAIVIFMSVYYKKAGLVAVGTLILNLFFLLAALSAFGATLTLPGLAGLALTVGMAVDSSVIIFERIRDEIRNGAGRDPAVAAGFDKALSAIFDSNLSTLISAMILYYFGTGPVRGFAVTLSLGILTTVFSAVFVSRLAFDYFSLKGPKGLSI